MKVLQFDTSGRGGIAHFIFFLSKSLAQRGIDIELLTTGENEMIGEMDFTVHPVLKPHYRIKSFYGKGFVYLHTLWRLAKTIRTRRPDIVHWHEIKIPTVELCLLRFFQKRDVRFVLSAHDVMHFERGRVTRALLELYQQFDFIIAHAENNRQIFLQKFNCDSKRTVVIPHGEYSDLAGSMPDKTSARRQLGVAIENRVVLFCGYIRRYKGLDLLLKAVAKAREKLPDLFLLIAGEAKEDFALYQELIDQLGLQESILADIRYIPLDRLPLYLAAADLVALPYRQIYQSGILYLAFGARRPVLATRVGGLQEVVQPGKNGFLCEPENIDDLAKNLVVAMQNIEVLEKMGEYAYIQSKEAFSWESIAEQIDRVYQKLFTLE